MGTHHVSIASFLPPSLRSRAVPQRLPHAHTASAGLLFADISGFTALTEKLAARGREGAEEIAAVVNAAFAPAIRAIEKQAGSIESFGGDALFATFADPAGSERAVAAAKQIAASFAKHGDVATSAGPVRLGVSQAVHHGRVAYLHLGDRERRTYLVTGTAVAELARLEAKASGGKLLVPPSARKRVVEASRATASLRAAAPVLAELRTYLPARLAPALEGFEGEYRNVAILFFETRGQGLAALQAWYLRLCEVLDGYEGLLLKCDLSPAGTKWVALFGIPRAHEEDRDRAARAALDLLTKAPRGIAIRGGLHAGIVANIVIGTRTRRSFDVMGDAVNTAARALAKSKWGEVLITDEVRRRLSGVKTRARVKHAVKGKAEPLALHALASAHGIVKQIRVSAPMIGRDAELRQIIEALERAKAGWGSVIGIKGEPGLGKSRLKYEAAIVAREMGFEVHEGRAISFGGMAYWTIGALLKDALGLPEVPSKEELLAKVGVATERLRMKPVDRHHLADLLGARYADSPIQHLQPKDIRLNAMIAMRAFCQAIANEKPRLYVLEDMHWADGASAEAAEWLAKGAGDAACVVLLLYRPGYELPKEAVEIVLHDLGEDAVERLLEAHLGMVPASVAKLVKERAGGNPFYVEEVVRHLLDAGILGMSDKGFELAREVRPDDLPDSIETLIATRLDRLSADARRVARYGAVIGRSFRLELLTHLPGMSRIVPAAVEELRGRELVFSRQRDRHVECVFKHALTRDVAYASLLASRRRKVHRAVALATEELFASERATLVVTLGHHWEQARDRGRARACYLEGARSARSRFALAEAEQLYRRYLSLVARATPESVATRTELGGEVLRLQGRMEEAAAAIGSALQEARRVRHRGLEASAMAALGIVRKVTGRAEEARRLYEGAILLMRELGDRASEGIVLGNLGALHSEQGRVEDARSHYEAALRIHRQDGDRRQEGIVLSNLAVLHHGQGRLDEARAAYDAALRIHREVGNRPFEGEVLGNLACLHDDHGEKEVAARLYHDALAVLRQVGERRSEGTVMGNLGSHRYEQGNMEEARELYEAALRIHRETANRWNIGHTLGNLAGLELLQTGALHRARELAAQGERMLRELDDSMDLAHLLCTRGYIELAAGVDARALLEEAVALARALGAGAESDIGRQLAQLDRAQRAFQAGAPLICGYCPEDLTAGQLRWLREHRPEAIAAEVMARLNADGTLRPEGPATPAESATRPSVR